MNLLGNLGFIGCLYQPPDLWWPFNILWSVHWCDRYFFIAKNLLFISPEMNDGLVSKAVMLRMRFTYIYPVSQGQDLQISPQTYICLKRQDLPCSRIFCLAAMDFSKIIPRHFSSSSGLENTNINFSVSFAHLQVIILIRFCKCHN